MKKILVAGVLLSVAPPVLSQTTVTAPKGFESKSGSSYTYGLGRMPSGRFQTAEGTLRGSPMVMTRVDYRSQRYYRYATYRGMGRSWSRVTLLAGETSIPTMSTTLANNHSTTPSTVFVGRVVWPSITQGVPVQKWGNTGSFPFGRAFSYSGKRDLLLDYNFEGGQLADSSTWNKSYGNTYYMDSEFIPTQSSVAYIGYQNIPERRPVCADSSQAAGSAAFTYAYGYVYSDIHPTTSLRGSAVIRAYSAFMARGARSLAALTLDGSTTGVDVGARCNRFHVDLRTLVALVARGTSAAGTVGDWFSPAPIPYDNTFAGLGLWLQAAWSDSKTGRLALTTASRSVLPRKPNGAVAKMSVYVYYQKVYMSPSSYVATLPRFTLK